MKHIFGDGRESPFTDHYTKSDETPQKIKNKKKSMKEHLEK